jgi:hypothetical protein
MLVIIVVLVVKMKLEFFLIGIVNYPYKYIILIAGNHDFSLKKHLNMKLKLLAYPTVIYQMIVVLKLMG